MAPCPRYANTWASRVPTRHASSRPFPDSSEPDVPRPHGLWPMEPLSFRRRRGDDPHPCGLRRFRTTELPRAAARARSTHCCATPPPRRPADTMEHNHAGPTSRPWSLSDLARVAAKYRRLAEDLERVARGEHPTEEDLRDAPLLMEWTVRFARGRISPASFSDIRGSRMEAFAGRANSSRSIQPPATPVRCRGSIAYSQYGRYQSGDHIGRQLRPYYAMGGR